MTQTQMNATSLSQQRNPSISDEEYSVYLLRSLLSHVSCLFP